MTANAIWCVVPVKRLQQAKLRLAPVLDATERAGLARAMAEDVLRAVIAVDALAGVLVVTADLTIAALASEIGVGVIADESDQGYNAAVERAARYLIDTGARGILVLPADVPSVTPADIVALLDAHGSGPAVTLVAAEADGGTNALACSPVNAIPFGFGEGSFARHHGAARACNIVPMLPSLPNLARDIDRPDDLAAFMKRPAPTHTHAFLAALIGSADRFAMPQPVLQQVAS
ncbi:2-phospho-L-lactate guanylyltransferase [Kaistia algarum]|uniref:2-phospho-L-lactate guanylyltransferase n=1 Tax=Kaistia algarum TaxID=2083279 RepID=UPI000CE90FBF|nr:2-phospho-L-lactate guanylyltransferase [Kaistia algarum]MCX5515817.1 2-phospho-L-lactate guanylyltransferase [Kaistia algarum]PPE80811.1 2-phospho-L-lactate guanylyltransferase [Kaistia algarum]